VQDSTALDRLYIVTRSDLPLGLQAAQAAHAAFEFSKAHPLICRGWMEVSNFIVLVTVPDLSSLEEIATSASSRGLRVSLNFEPDVGNELTAVVVEPHPEARRLCSALPLLGKGLLSEMIESPAAATGKDPSMVT